MPNPKCICNRKCKNWNIFCNNSELLLLNPIYTIQPVVKSVEQPVPRYVHVNLRYFLKRLRTYGMRALFYRARTNRAIVKT